MLGTSPIVPNMKVIRDNLEVLDSASRLSSFLTSLSIITDHKCVAGNIPELTSVS